MICVVYTVISKETTCPLLREGDNRLMLAAQEEDRKKKKIVEPDADKEKRLKEESLLIEKMEANASTYFDELDRLKSAEFTRDGKTSVPPKSLSLFELAQRVDAGNVSKNHDSSCVLTYRLAYFHLSRFTHAAVGTLGTYITSTEGTIDVNQEYDPISGLLPIATSYTLLADSFMDLLQLIGVDVSDFRTRYQAVARGIVPQKDVISGT